MQIVIVFLNRLLMHVVIHEHHDLVKAVLVKQVNVQKDTVTGINRELVHQIHYLELVDEETEQIELIVKKSLMIKNVKNIMNVLDKKSNQVSVKKKSVVMAFSILVNNAMEKGKHNVANELPVLRPVKHLVRVSTVK
jgi:hypothetical protein